MSDSDVESTSPLYKKQKGTRGAMAGRGGKRPVDRRNSQEGLNSKDILEALDALRKEFTSQFKNFNERLDKVDSLGTKIIQVEKRMGVWEKRLKQMEIEEKRKWVVIKGLWKQDDVVNYKTKKQLGTSLEELKAIMGISTPFMEYYRLKDFKRNNETFPGLVKVKFVTSDERDFFFSRVIQTGSSEDLKGVSFQQDIPAFLVDDYKKLDGVAFNLRKTDKVRTRIVIRNLGLVLQKRERVDGARWSNIGQRQNNQEGAAGAGTGASDGAGASNWTED